MVIVNSAGSVMSVLWSTASTQQTNGSACNLSSSNKSVPSCEFFLGLRSRADDVSILLERGASSHKNGELLYRSCISLIQVPAGMQTSWKLSFLYGCCTTSPGDNQKRFTNSESVNNNGQCAVENCNNFFFPRFMNHNFSAHVRATRAAAKGSGSYMGPAGCWPMD